MPRREDWKVASGMAWAATEALVVAEMAWVAAGALAKAEKQVRVSAVVVRRAAVADMAAAEWVTADTVAAERVAATVVAERVAVTVAVVEAEPVAVVANPIADGCLDALEKSIAKSIASVRPV